MMKELPYTYRALNGQEMTLKYVYEGSKEEAIETLKHNFRWSATPLVAIDGKRLENVLTPNPQSANEKPKHKHDCSECVFLGSVLAHGIWADLYYCQQGGNPTVIARYSDEGSDYASGWPFGDPERGTVAELIVARIRSTAKGLGETRQKQKPSSHRMDRILAIHYRNEVGTGQTEACLKELLGDVKQFCKVSGKDFQKILEGA